MLATLGLTPGLTTGFDYWFHYWSVSRSSSRPVAAVRADERRPPLSADSLFRDRYGDSEDEDDEVGYADPVQDDLYSRKVGLAVGQLAGAGAAQPYDKFLPKFWTPEEDVHIQKIKLGSQRRPWYRKMQGFRCV